MRSAHQQCRMFQYLIRVGYVKLCNLRPGTLEVVVVLLFDAELVADCLGVWVEFEEEAMEAEAVDEEVSEDNDVTFKEDEANLEMDAVDEARAPPVE